jgi:PAS domain S-box-containing protein
MTREADAVRATSAASFLSRGGEMGRVIRALDWSKSPIGSIESWSPTLLMLVRLILSNSQQMVVWWGPRLIQIYNDAAWPALGDKHPRSMGQPASECWAEIWHIIAPLIETPFAGGPATWMDDILLHVNRKGFMEETHWTIAYSPVLDETAPSGIGGVIGTVNEITEKIIGERRLLLLRDLGACASEPKTAEQACAVAAETLAHCREDVPFALLYLVSEDRKLARLSGVAGVAAGLAESPLEVDLTPEASGEVSWPIAEAFRSEAVWVVEDLPSKLANVPPGPWPDPPRTAVVCPVPSNVANQLAGLLVLGVSSHLSFDDRYRGFFDLVTSQVAATIANARAYDMRDALQLELASQDGDVSRLTEELVTSRRSLQQSLNALRASEEKYRTLFESIDEGFCIIEMLFDHAGAPIDYRFLEVSPSFEKQTGIKNARGRRMREIAPQHEEHWFEIYGRIALTGEPVRFENPATQLNRWYDVYAFRIGEPQSRRVAVLFKDITERKQAEQELRTSEERFRRYFDLGLIGMAISSPEKRCVEVNDEMCRILGYSRGELLERSWAEMTHPDDLAADVEQFDRVMAGEVDGYSTDKRWIRKDGRVIDGIMAAQCMRRADGSVDYFVSLVLDTTERKRAERELRTAQHELAHLTRVLSMGELTASIAHEVSQPLTAIVANASACQRWLALEKPNLDEARQSIEGVVRDGVRAAEVIQRIRALSAKGAPAEQISVDINQIIREVLTQLQSEMLAHRVSVWTELSAGLASIRGDRVQLQQVFLNLIRNGVEAMASVTQRPKQLLIRSSSEDSHELLLTVRDTGIGLNAEAQRRLFDAFFTTKPKGMGLGLSISRRIVETHGGRLWATPGDGFGATFHCALPVEKAPV